MEASFYHLTRQTLPVAASRLVGLARLRGLKLGLVCDSTEMMQSLSNALWSHRQDYCFLAHAHGGSGLGETQARRQKIWLTTAADLPNQPEILLVCEAREWQDLSLGGVQRVLDVFDGKDEVALAAARTRFRQARAAGIAVTYYAQKDSGGWFQPNLEKNGQRPEG